VNSRVPAIVGVGATAFTNASGVSEMELAVEAISRAVADAGLGFADIDGLVTYEMDANDPLTMANALSLQNLTWFSITHYGGGLACATVQDAALAVRANLADTIVVYRAANMRSAYRFGQGDNTPNLIFPGGRWSAPYGMLTPAQLTSLWFMRYFHEYGLSNSDLAPVVLSARDFASTNPAARHYGRPLDLGGYQQEPWICEPVLRRADCCLETDGGIAVVVTSHAKAANCRQTPVYIAGAARGMAPQSSLLRSYLNYDGTDVPDLKLVARQLWEQTGMCPSDISALMVYDSFSPLVLLALEAFGFCSPGTAAGFAADGHIGRQGSLPVNPHGGLIGEGYVQGFNGIAEGVRQVRGDAVNQIEDVSAVVVTGAPPQPTSAIILAADPTIADRALELC
jgi:acetyl-CoA acetyltransferase